MKRLTVFAFLLLSLSARAADLDDAFDRAAAALTFGNAAADTGARFSGTLDLEGYALPYPAPGLIDAPGRSLFSPRLTLNADAQLGPHLYLFAQGRFDRGFDPSDDSLTARLDEAALRFTPWRDGRINFQVGKFATVIGNWVQRHHSWDNPFVTAPLPYENLTGVWDAVAAESLPMLLAWAHIAPGPIRDNLFPDKYLRLPIVWGPAYSSGASVFGRLGKWQYAAELKNAALAARPALWNSAATHWGNPEVGGRISYQPNESWTFGLSASTGTYLRPSAEATLPPGATLGDYRQTVFAHDLGFAWHHLQLWAEIYRARFALPRVGQADTWAGYVEIKYRFLPQLSGALRWNQQLFGTLQPASGPAARWGRNIWRLDVAPAWRFTSHIQLKLQYSLQHEDDDRAPFSHLGAAQLTVRF